MKFLFKINPMMSTISQALMILMISNQIKLMIQLFQAILMLKIKRLNIINKEISIKMIKHKIKYLKSNHQKIKKNNNQLLRKIKKTQATISKHSTV